MSLRVALLTNYPLIDNVEWKRNFATKIKDAGFYIDVHYGKKDLKSLFFSYLRKRKYSYGVVKKTKANSIKNRNFFKKRGIKVTSYNSLNSTKAITAIKKGNYDIIITALDQILTKNFIKTVNTSIINVHYGALPSIKGTSALEWTYFKHKRCELTLHYIDSGIDTGLIISRKEIAIDGPVLFTTLRSEVQNHIPKILYDFLIKVKNDENLITSPNDRGYLYTFMHPDMIRILENQK
ncbi:formyltransferase family protein [Winogradskyella sp.]|uniref:formyltransferase family protein n=1 Tax=Winogradskyella sp. TaxID=1883156 RepID=UPI0026233AB9|nr:formyltransferase family protein [Winogradskyella sp.]